MKKWEYTSSYFSRGLYTNLAKFMDYLNEMGSAGWELVIVVDLPDKVGCVFKKEAGETG